jgi:XTP/dITP diphosphohydrolase
VTAFVLATTNAHKAEEIRTVLGDFEVELLPRPADVPDVDETEDTLEGNALLKARALSSATGLPAIADDTGFFVDALSGRPGVYSARYAGEGVAFEENVKKVLGEMTDVADDQRGARFRTVVAVSYPNGDEWWVEGALEGTVLRGPKGDGGFGYDPIFAPSGENGRSLGELSVQEKNLISHRGNALRAFAQKLNIS